MHSHSVVYSAKLVMIAVEAKKGLDHRKLAGKANPADLGTKVLSSSENARRIQGDLNLRVVTAITDKRLRVEV